MSDKIFPATLKPIVSKSYGQTRGGNIWRSQVQGGLPRQGLDVFYDAVPISVVLVVPALGRQAFWSFIASISGGADSFQMTHDTGNGLEPHNVLITSNISETTQDGINWVISFTATAERTSIQESTDFSEALWPLYGEYGEALKAYIDWYAIYCTTPNFIFDYYESPVIQTNGVTAYFDGVLYYNNNNAVAFSDLVTFSRLSAGSYIEGGVLKTSAANEPRFEDDGLLIEPQSTNVVTISERWSASAYASPAWTHSAADAEGWITVTGGGLAGAAEGSYRDLNSSSAVWSSTSTFSLDIRNDIPYSFAIRSFNSLNPDGFGIVTLTFSSGSALPSHPSLKIVDMGTWIRITHTRTFGASGTSFFRLYPFGLSTGALGSLTYRRVQVEKLSYATSYIKTTGTAATRAADSASVLMQSHTAGTIFCEFLSDAVAIERTIYTAGSITLKRLATGAISVTAGAVTVTSAVVPLGSVKSAISYDGSTLKLAVNGVVYSAASTLPYAGTSLALGYSTFANVWQRSEAYDNARLIEVTQ